MNRKGSVLIVVVVIVVILLIAGGIWYYAAHKVQVSSQSLIQQINQQLPNNSTSTATATPLQGTASPAQIMSTILPDGIALNGGFDMPDGVPGKYACGGYSITMPDVNSINYPRSVNLVLLPAGKLLLDTSAFRAEDYDATFSVDCRNIYWSGGEYTSGAPQISVYDIASGTMSTLSIPTANLENYEVSVGDGNEFDYPFINYIYAIDDSHLLLGFYTNGGSGDPDQEPDTYGIYDTPSESLTIFAQQAQLPVNLLNYETNTWIIPKDGYQTGIIDDRIETNLGTGQQIDVALKAPLLYQFTGETNTCDGDSTDQDIIDACYNEWLNQFLQ